MSGVTAVSMYDARDEEDKRLLEAGQIDLLLAGWYETIVGRCVAKMRGPAGYDVVQVVCERLWAVTDGAPSYFSVFAGRIADAGIDPVPLMRERSTSWSPRRARS